MTSTKTKSMLEKLTEDYAITTSMGNGGHAVGYYSERRREIVKGEYEFEKGVYTIKQKVQGKFFLWDYDIKRHTQTIEFAPNAQD